MPALNLANPVNLAAPLNRGLLAWWMAVNQGPYFGGARFFDLLGKNHGTLVSASTWASAGPLPFGALTFDGTGFVTLNCPLIQTAMTVALWVNGTFVDAFDTPWKVADTTAGVYNYAGTNVQWQLYTAVGQLHSINYAGALDGTWHHLAMTYDGATMAVYLDGVSQGTTPASGNIEYNGNGFSSFAIGGGNPWAGRLADLRLYGRGLSAGEIIQLYAASRTGYRNELNWIRRGFAATAAAAPAGTGASIFSGGILNSGIIGIAA
jgi:hypothetical protein